MDLDGNISFTRRDGGKIILQEFTSATGRKGTGHRAQDKVTKSFLRKWIDKPWNQNYFRT